MPMEKQIETIMDCFRFDTIAKFMRATNWTWRGEIVGEDKLRTTARKLLKDAIAIEGECSTGGLRAEYLEGNEEVDSSPFLRLSFVLEEWDTYDGP